MHTSHDLTETGEVNRLVDFSKVSVVKDTWINQDGDSRKTKPEGWTVHGEAIDPEGLAHPNPHYPGETMGQRSTRLGNRDVWKFHVSFRLSHGVKEIFTGRKGRQLLAAYRAHLFGRKRRGD